MWVVLYGLQKDNHLKADRETERETDRYWITCYCYTTKEQLKLEQGQPEMLFFECSKSKWELLNLTIQNVLLDADLKHVVWFYPACDLISCRNTEMKLLGVDAKLLPPVW